MRPRPRCRPAPSPTPSEIARAAQEAADRQASQAQEEADRAEAERAAREARELAARPRAELCERIEKLQGEKALDELEVATAEWEGMPALDDRETHDELMRRFERATRACQKRHAEWKDVERRRVRLRELAGAAVAAAALEDLPAARKQFAAIRREWHDLGAGMINDSAVIEQYTAAQTQFAARDAAAHEQDQKTRREALTRAQQLVGRIEAVAGRADLTLKAGERALKDLRSALSTVPQLPSKKDYDEIVKRLKGAQTALMPKVQELRDVAGWQRWANVGIQEQLCEKMEALKAVEDPEAIAKQVRTLQEQWRQAADVPRAQGEALWKRFKTAHDEAWTRCEAHFAAQSEARGANLAKKVALCERAEALADSTSWIQTADEIKKLQAEWKTIGAVSRGQEKSIWERFRSACDRFFTRRHADLAERKTVWSDNLAKKEALCARADALKDSSEWDAAASEMKRLQAEWKTVGPVKKSRSEALWQRFRGAADHFFARYAQRHDIALGERVAAREAICQELEALAAAPVVAPSPDEPVRVGSRQPESAVSDPPVGAGPEPPADLMATVRALRGRWQAEIAARGVDRDRALALDDRFAKAFAAVIARWPAVFGGTDLDPDANRKKMETIVVRIETLAKSLGGPASAGADAALSPTARMAAMLKEALAANTIGGKTDDDSRFRAAADDVRQAQAALSRIGPVPDQVRRSLADRFQRATRRIADVTHRRLLADLDQLDVEHEQPVRRLLAFVGELLGDPETGLFAFEHQLQTLGPARDHVIEAEGRRLAAHHRAVEHLSVGRPAGVVHGHFGVRPWMPSPDTLRQYLVRQAARRRLGIGRRRLHVGRRAGGDVDQLDVEHQHPLRLARSLVGEPFGNPQPALFTRHHQLQPFAEAGDDAPDGKARRLALGHRAVEHRAVGLPPGVVNGDDVLLGGMLGALAFGDDLGRQTGGCFDRVRRRRGHIRWRRNGRRRRGLR